MSSVLDNVIEEVKHLNRKEKVALVERLLTMKEFQELAEEIEDALIVLARRDEPQRSYDEFARELKDKGLLK